MAVHLWFESRAVISAVIIFGGTYLFFHTG